MANHPECFNTDTVRITDIQIKVEKQTIKIDSIVYDTLPGVESVIEKTVYLTKTIAKSDTIYKSKEVIKINPLNEQLANDNDVLTKKVKKWRNWALKSGLSLIGLILIIIGYFYLRLKKF